MKMKNIFLSIIILTAMIYSCKKDKDNEPTTPVPNNMYPNFSQLTVGNYWIYEQFDVDSANNASTKNIFDSCYVEKDTIINTKTYLKIVKPDPYSTNQKTVFFQRDSLHYVVDSDGKILFSSQDFSTIFESKYFLAGSDTICQIIRQMTDKNIAVNTPAGTFTTSNAREVYSMFPAWSSAGNPRYRNTRYAENIGIVIETLPFFTSNPNYIERRLVRCYINQIVYPTK